MKIHFIWPDCTFDGFEWYCNPVDCYWIEADQNEAEEYFLRKLHKDHLQEFFKACRYPDYLDRWYRGHRGNGPSDNNFRFLVAKDLSRVSLGFAVYPYSGMWGVNPFKEFVAEINKPEDLKCL